MVLRKTTYYCYITLFCVTMPILIKKKAIIKITETNMNLKRGKVKEEYIKYRGGEREVYRLLVALC